MRILFLAHAFNSLTQRLYVELTDAGHEVSIEFDVNDQVTAEALALFRPDLVVAPFLKRRIPDAVWRAQRCIVIHPGIEGDRGPSALDWAITDGEREWGVTALEASAEMDGGDVWASVGFPMRDAAKGSLYRNEVTAAAVAALRETLARIAAGERPRPLDAARPGVRGRLRPALRQADRAIDWRTDDKDTVLRRIRAADGVPGVLDAIAGEPCYLYDAHPEGALRGGEPGALIAQRDGAVLRATVDGAVWITHLKRAGGDDVPAFKLPAAMVLGERLAGVPEAPLPPEAIVAHPTWRPIRYEERDAVGYLHFPFYNGAMGTAHCDALRRAYAYARSRPTRVIVLLGGPDFWSNGIHLNLIEADDHPAEASWRNINAMNDLVREIIVTDRQLTIAALQGNAGAGGVFLALAADRVYARDGVVLNPHYKGMGNLYGSEYWTYLLPRRVTPEQARAVTGNRLPVGVRGAAAMGLIDGHFGATPAAFRDEVARRAQALAGDPGFARAVAERNRRREADEAQRPLESYRAAELERMKLNFFGFDSSYHVARHNFVQKVPRSRTPLYLAQHRARPRPAAAAEGQPFPESLSRV
jgi:putative two-component system protein, hydrogenase maturation factor HypX/HoxX